MVEKRNQRLPIVELRFAHSEPASRASSPKLVSHQRSLHPAGIPNPDVVKQRHPPRRHLVSALALISDFSAWSSASPSATRMCHSLGRVIRNSITPPLHRPAKSPHGAAPILVSSTLPAPRNPAPWNRASWGSANPSAARPLISMTCVSRYFKVGSLLPPPPPYDMNAE